MKNYCIRTTTYKGIKIKQDKGEEEKLNKDKKDWRREKIIH